jgi:hypothetical protein
MVVEHVDLHVGWDAALTMQVPLGMMEDVVWHELGDHVIEGVTEDRMQVVVGVVAITDFVVCIIISHCIKFSMASSVAVGVDCQLKGAFSNTTHALGVEHVYWYGLSNAQSGDDAIDVIHPSQDTACILNSLEVVHVELVLSRVGISRVHLEGKFLALIACRSLAVNGDQRQGHSLGRRLLIVSQVTKGRLGRHHHQDFSCSKSSSLNSK